MIIKVLLLMKRITLELYSSPEFSYASNLRVMNNKCLNFT